VDGKQFDWLARFSASGVDRRVIVRSLAAGALAEIGMVGLADRVGAQAADPGVIFFELLAAKMKRVKGDCDALAAVAADLHDENLRIVVQIRKREELWDTETRTRVATKYQKRITNATETLHTLMASCRFRGAPEAAVCTPAGGDPVEIPGAAQCAQGCDCPCICPMTAGLCTWSFFSCLGGSHAACCWFGACASHQCLEQCPNCCNCGVSCCGC